MKNRTAVGPASKAILDYLRSNLQAGAWQTGERLPSSRLLAQTTGVSVRTVLKALTILKNEGTIHGTAKSRMRAGAYAVIAAPGKAVSSTASRHVRERLESDIRNGVFSAMSILPTYKELETRYGMGYRALRNILDSMARDGAVLSRGRTFVLPAAGEFRRQNRIVFITYRAQVRLASALNQGHYRLLESLELECIRRGQILEVAELDFYDRVGVRRALQKREVNPDAQGYVVDVWWDGSETYRRSHRDLFAFLERYKKPVAVIDEIGNFSMPLEFSANPLFQSFRIENRRAGGCMARLFINLGHRTIAYISPRHNASWSIERLEGIEEQFANAGLAGNVVRAVSTGFASSYEHLLDMSGFDDRLIKRIIAMDRTESQAEDSFEIVRRYRETREKKAATVPADVRKALDSIAAMARLDMEPGMFNLTAHAAFGEAGRRLGEHAMTPLFSRALADSRVTAWVCATDETALAALEFLHARDIEVPRHLSVAGFDNTPVKGVSQRLTSYDFNVHGFVNRALDFVARPPRPHGTCRHQPIEVAGTVMERETTAIKEGYKAGALI